MITGMEISALPRGSTIRLVNSPDGLCLTWPNSDGGTVRYGIAAFLLFWLVCWACGEFSVIKHLVAIKANGPRLFLALWMAGWTLGGLMAVKFLFGVVRAPKPEKLIFSRDYFIHDPGSEVLSGFSRRRRDSGVPSPAESLQELRTTRVMRTALGAINLSFEGKRRRLILEVGADRIEVGRHLEEPDKEWLAAVLRAWKEARP